MPKQEYTDSQGLTGAWDSFSGFLTDHWLVILFAIVTLFVWRWVTNPREVPATTAGGKPERRVNLKVAVPVIVGSMLGWIIYFTKGNFTSIGLPKIDNWTMPVIALVSLVPLFLLGYKSLLPRKWMVNFVQSKPTAHPRLYWPSLLSFVMAACAILAMALIHIWWIYLAAILVIVAGYWTSVFVKVPIRQVFMLTWFGKPFYEGCWLIPGSEKLLTVGLKRLWLPICLSGLDFIPLAYVKRENKFATDWLECEAISGDDPERGDEAVAAGPSFKINAREAHRLHLDHVETFWSLDDHERDNIDEYIIGVIQDWLADYMHDQRPADVLSPGFLAGDAEQAPLKAYVLESTGYELLELGILRREPDANYKAQLDEYASKHAEEQTALRDIAVQGAKGQAFMARLTAMTDALNASLEGMGKSEKVTIDEVWDKIIEDQRSRRAASHYIGGGKIAGLLSGLARGKK